MRARRLFSLANLLVTVVLLGVLFIMVNYLAGRRYARWDFSRQQITALSDKTVQALKGLTAPVSIVVFYQPGHRLYGMVRDQLEEYARASSKITVEYVDPEQDIARARTLTKEFQVEDANIVIFKSGSRHKYLSDTDLAEYDYPSMPGAEPRVSAFKGEEAFTSAIIGITQADSPLLWVVSGHGEKSVKADEPGGLSGLRQYLEQQNMTVEEVTLLERSSVPPNVKMILLPGPTRRFTDTELALLQTYLDRGGRLLALADPLDDTGLDGLLARWGVALGADIVVDPARQLPFVSAANLFVTTYTQHPMVAKMKTLMTLFPLARSVRPAQPPPAGLTVTPLALTSERGWGETHTGSETFEFKAGEDLPGPVSIAVAVERDTPARTRLVVIGDSDFIINAQLGNVGNRDLLMGALYWLVEQEQLIGIGPKRLESIKLTLTAPQLTRVFWFGLLGLPLLCGTLGVGMWWVRRR